jgi:hypothetical protein
VRVRATARLRWRERKVDRFRLGRRLGRAADDALRHEAHRREVAFQRHAQGLPHHDLDVLLGDRFLGGATQHERALA